MLVPAVLNAVEYIFVEHLSKYICYFIVIKDFTAFNVHSPSFSVYSCTLKIFLMSRHTEFLVLLMRYVLESIPSRQLTTSEFVVTVESFAWSYLLAISQLLRRVLHYL